MVHFLIFPNSDLRRASINPNYLTPDVYMCDLILERKGPRKTDVMTGRLFFQSSTNLKDFQRALTGYKVKVDLSVSPNSPDFVLAN